jgi:subtilisin-like proprotein convertase family protein
MKLSFTLFFALLTLGSFAQTFTGTGGPILDDGSDNFYSLSVSGVVPAVMDTNYGLETVCINLTHTWDDDLTITLIAPDGTEFELTSHNGGDGDNYTNTCFNYGAPQAIYQTGAPFTGTFRPEGAMSLANNGQNPNGVWTLHILDTYPFADAGTLLDWSVTFGDDPAIPFPFTQANLPLVSIMTNGSVIQNEPKTLAHMRIIKNPNNLPNHLNDSANVYAGLIGIELRGHSGQGMPKKSFGFETRSDSINSQNVSLLGMPSESDWVLVANFSDKTLLRNYYSYRLYRKMGNWAPRMEFCEVVIDGEYQGIYLLGEKIKRDANRVDIHSLNANDTTGIAVTGGYIFRADWVDPGDVTWTSNFAAVNATENLKFTLVYPKAENVKPAQLNYIKSYVDNYEAKMFNLQFADTNTGWRQYADEQSFIDYIILTEFTKNVDGYRLSTYFYKDREGKIHAGPPWDYDLSWGNADYMNCSVPNGWDYQIQMSQTNQCPFWWQRYFQDTLFQKRLRCRWTGLYQNIFNPVVINHELDSLANVLSVSTDLNFTKWPILGVYVWPNPSPIPTTYQGEINNIKSWVNQRITWLDSHWPGSCDIYTNVDNTLTETESPVLFPNPNQGRFTMNLPKDCIGKPFQVSDLSGKSVLTGIINSFETTVTCSLNPGLYFIRIEGQKQSQFLKLMVQ